MQKVMRNAGEYSSISPTNSQRQFPALPVQAGIWLRAALTSFSPANQQTNTVAGLPVSETYLLFTPFGTARP
jgi:hypothetical protein